MRSLSVMLCCAVTALGCQPAGAPPAAPVEAPESPPPAAAVKPQPTTAPAAARAPADAAGSAVMATVNGRPIYMAALIRPLVQTGGLRIAEMLVAHAVVDQEAQRRRIAVTKDDIAAERAEAMDQIFPTDLSGDQRQLLLDRLLRQRGLTRELWEATLRQNALLTRMAEPRVVIDEAMLKAEFGRLYGEKVEVSHIVVPGLTEAEKIIRLLKDGQDFAELARQYSTNSVTAKAGGLLPAFGHDEPSVPRAMRDAAFALQAGQISGIVQTGNRFHVLKLHKRLASTKVQYETVKAQVAQSLRRQMLRRLRAEILAELRRKAQVEIVHPLLREAAETPAP